MANLLHLQPSSSARVRRRHCSTNCEIDLWRTIVRRGSLDCRASRGGRFRFRAEEEFFRDGGFGRFEFGNRKKKKRPWWFDDDDYDDYDSWMNEDDDSSMVFEGFRALSWMLAPIGISLLLGTDSNAGLTALAVPLLQSVFSLVVSKVFSKPSIGPVSRYSTVSSAGTRKARQEVSLEV